MYILCVGYCQAKRREGELAGKKTMGTNDNVDIADLNTMDGFLLLSRRDKTR